MALIDYVRLDAATGRARETLQRFQDEHGQTPLIYEALAHNEHVVGARYDYFSAVMDGGDVDRAVKEFVYVVVSEANACEYCVGAHSRVYTDVLGGEPADLELVAEGEFGALDGWRRAVATFADQVTRDPKRVTAAHLDDLRDAGFSTADIIELLVVAASAKAANTIVDALNIHPVDRETAISSE